MTKQTKTLSTEEIVTERTMGRRSTMALIGAGAGAAVIGAAMPSTAAAQCSDSDPYDPGGYGRHCGGTGCSDSDPYDPGGAGRHCGAGCYPCRGVSDYDPRDPSGCGCHGCSDSDPYDPGGAGRHC